MRFRINLSTAVPKRFLPIDYQYSLASAVYRIIARGDENYSRFLHDDGFSGGGLKRFKMFTFSALTLPPYRIWKGKGVFELHEPHASFTVSFVVDKAAEAFIKGMFHNQQFALGDRFHALPFEVTSVEALPPPFFTRTMRYRCTSPMVVEWKEPGLGCDTYLAPDDPRFEQRLVENLVAKCAAMNTLLAEEDQGQPVSFELNGSYRSKLHAIKPYTKAETRVRGFLFDFTLTAPEHVHEIGYYGGFGMNNAMGFGCVEGMFDA